MSLRKFLAVTILLALPLVVVHFVKQTTWGEMRAAPAARLKGDPAATVLLVEYSDFQCPMCNTVQPAIQQFMEAYKGKIRFAYKYFPLAKVHHNAMAAALAAECAAAQDQFWPYHDKLFAAQKEWAPLTNPTTHFAAMGEALTLDMTEFRECLADPSKRLAIELDVREGKERQVSATPTFFIGDERLVGTAFMSEGARTIEKALRKNK